MGKDIVAGVDSVFGVFDHSHQSGSDFRLPNLELKNVHDMPGPSSPTPGAARTFNFGGDLNLGWPGAEEASGDDIGELQLDMPGDEDQEGADAEGVEDLREEQGHSVTSPEREGQGGAELLLETPNQPRRSDRIASGSGNRGARPPARFPR